MRSLLLVPIFLFFGLVSALAEPDLASPPDLGDIDSQAAKIPLYLLHDGKAEVDGTARPELGNSITDSLAQGLILNSQIRVVSDLGDSKTPDYTLSSRLVGEQGTYRLTVRKTKYEEEEEKIVAIYSATATEVFSLVDDILGQISPQTAAPAMAVAEPVLPELDAPSPPARSAWTAVPSLSGPKKRSPSPSTSRKTHHPVVYPKPVYERERVGVIKAVNDDWDFVVITADRSSHIKTHEILEILYDGPQGSAAYAKLEIDRIDGNKIVANFGGDSRGKREIFPGEIVYSWRKQ